MQEITENHLVVRRKNIRILKVGVEFLNTVTLSVLVNSNLTLKLHIINNNITLNTIIEYVGSYKCDYYFCKCKFLEH